MLIAVNCSERKKPPTTRMMKISSSGVVSVNSAQAARNTELTTALTVIRLRKPKVRMMRARQRLHAHGADGGGERHQAGLERRQAEADLHQQRQQERQRADAEPEQEAADDAGAHGRKLQQAKSSTGDPVRLACMT